MTLEKLALLFCFASLATGFATALQCVNKAGLFEANSSFASIRQAALSYLAPNVTKAGGYFNTTITSTDGRSKIHAVALCREGFDPESCSGCVSDAAKSLVDSCSNNYEAYTWGGDVPCLVRYSDKPIVTSFLLEPVDNALSGENVTMNLTRFDRIWDPFMRRVLEKASLGSSSLKYNAKDKKKFGPLQYMFAFAQCPPYLSRRQCTSCLQQSHADYKNEYDGRQGGVIAKPSCFYRWDLYPFYNAFNEIPALAVPPPLSHGRERRSISSRAFATIIIIIVLAFVVLIAVLVTTFATLWRRRFCREPAAAEDEAAPSFRVDFGTVRDATDGFAITNKLGQGGFGTVFKGRLKDGKDVAVKRLSPDSGQGEREFKNEVTLLAKLQHRNLVKLLGYCLEGNERILLYEYVPNSSLDGFLNDPDKRATLTWDVRYKIIEGVARGLQYLHEESALMIIHRDLKSSNILLDSEMTPKISDFGMARIFTQDQTRAETSRVAGTYGYMPPEYIMHGHFSARSDVYSFGIVMLEILCGQKNRGFQSEAGSESLLAYAWRSWSEGKSHHIFDPMLVSQCSDEVMKCIQIGLLCVQEDIAKRPRMNTVILWLKRDLHALPEPSKPAFLLQGNVPEPEGTSSSSMNPVSRNSVSITLLEAR